MVCAESGKPAARADGAQFLRAENGTAVFAVASGECRFRSELAGK